MLFVMLHKVNSLLHRAYNYVHIYRINIHSTHAYTIIMCIAYCSNEQQQLIYCIRHGQVPLNGQQE